MNRRGFECCVLWISIIVGGCSREDQPCFVGDDAAPPELELVYWSRNRELTNVIPGATVPMFQPLQGGQVFFVGARVRNVDHCSIRIDAQLIDPCGDRVLSIEERPVRLVVHHDGWAVPEDHTTLANFAHVPACPIPDADRDIDDELYRLRVRVEDSAGRSAVREVDIVLVCGEPELEARCKCTCNSEYIPEDRCTLEVDGGPSPGTCLN